MYSVQCFFYSTLSGFTKAKILHLGLIFLTFEFIYCYLNPVITLQISTHIHPEWRIVNGMI